MGTVRGTPATGVGLTRVVMLGAGPRTHHTSFRPLFSPAMESTSSPALSVAIAVLAVLLGLTGFGVYTAFGPPSKTLSDPFDDHDD